MFRRFQPILRDAYILIVPICVFDSFSHAAIVRSRTRDRSGRATLSKLLHHFEKALTLVSEEIVSYGKYA
jgi:hypothetical protein